MPGDTIRKDRADAARAAPPDTATLVRLLKAGDGLGYEELSVEQMTFANGKGYALVRGSYVNCGFTYWVLYEGGAIKKCMELEKECDDDLSWAEYDYKHYEAVSDTLFRVFKVTQTVKDKRHLDRDGNLKDHASRDDFELKNDTVAVVVSPSFLLSKHVPGWPKVWTE